MAEARRRIVPAFRIFSDRALKAMASRRPGAARELLGISGIGMTTVERYGQQIYRIVKDNSDRDTFGPLSPLKTLSGRDSDLVVRTKWALSVHLARE